MLVWLFVIYARIQDKLNREETYILRPKSWMNVHSAHLLLTSTLPVVLWELLSFKYSLWMMTPMTDFGTETIIDR